MLGIISGSYLGQPLPDFIAALGFTDDAAVFWAAFNSVKSQIQPRHIEEAARRLAALRGENG